MKIIDIKITNNYYLVFPSIEKRIKFELQTPIDTTVIYAKIIPEKYLGENIFDTSELVILNTTANFGILIIPSLFPTENEIIEAIKNYSGTINEIISEQAPEEVGGDSLFREIRLKTENFIKWIYNETSPRPYHLSSTIENSIMVDETSNYQNLYIPSNIYLEYKSNLDFWTGAGITVEEKKERLVTINKILQKISLYPFEIFEGSQNKLTLVAERIGIVFLKIINENNIVISFIRYLDTSIIKGRYYYGPYTIDNFLEPLIKQLKRIGF